MILAVWDYKNENGIPCHCGLDNFFPDGGQPGGLFACNVDFGV